MATQGLIRTFFPTTLSLMSDRWWWHYLQPAWLASECPEQVVRLPLVGGMLRLGTALTLRNPALLPFQLAGVAVGWTEHRKLRAVQQHTYLAHSMLFFACMNLS